MLKFLMTVLGWGKRPTSGAELDDDGDEVGDTGEDWDDDADPEEEGD